MLTRNVPKKTRVALLAAAGVLVAVSSLTAARAWRAFPGARNALPTIVKSAPASPVPQRRRPLADFESELITITPHGFEPREITRPQGRVLLMIDNRSGLAQVTPRMNLGAGVGLRDVALPREQPNWSEVVNLSPGVYLLGEANHPLWVCRIVITAQ